MANAPFTRTHEVAFLSDADDDTNSNHSTTNTNDAADGALQDDDAWLPLPSHVTP